MRRLAGRVDAWLWRSAFERERANNKHASALRARAVYKGVHARLGGHGPAVAVKQKKRDTRIGVNSRKVQIQLSLAYRRVLETGGWFTSRNTPGDLSGCLRLVNTSGWEGARVAKGRVEMWARQGVLVLTEDGRYVLSQSGGAA